MSIAEKSIHIVREAWFDEFIASIRTHQLQLETGTANEELRSTYAVLMNGNDTDLALLGKANANRYFIRGMILDYINSIHQKMPIKLAFDMDDSEVLVWAEIEDGDEQQENFLLMAEAAVNATFHKYGYDLTSTIVEKSDCLSIPNHYAIYKY